MLIKNFLLKNSLIMGLIFKSILCADPTPYFYPKKVLLLYTGTKSMGGTRSYKLALYKRLYDKGFNIGFFIVNNHDVRAELEANKLPYFACDIQETEKEEYWQQIYQSLRKICATENIGLINCNKSSEVMVAQQLKKEFKTKTVLTIHVEGKYTNSFLKKLDGILTVSPAIAEQVTHQNKSNNLKIKNIEWTAPFFSPEKFLNFKPNRNAKSFFSQEFGIAIDHTPIITMVANFLDNSKWKDHPTLLKAVQELTKKRNIKLQVMLAGEGEYLNSVKNLAKKFGIDDCVHFLGRTELIPELFYHSNIKVLASKSEAFGIVLLEAALMHCPLIGTSDTGMENVIKHKTTGLLFKKSNAKDLADKIELLLNDIKLQKELSENAFKFVCNNFLPEVGIEKIIKFYQNILE